MPSVQVDVITYSLRNTSSHILSALNIIGKSSSLLNTTGNGITANDDCNSTIFSRTLMQHCSVFFLTPIWLHAEQSERALQTDGIHNHGCRVASEGMKNSTAGASLQAQHTDHGQTFWNLEYLIDCADNPDAFWKLYT